MGWLVTAVGAALIAVALRDVFHTLWHPSGHGGLSTSVTSSLWRISRRSGFPARLAAVVGPAAMATVVVMWTSIIVTGWTLVYWPHMPGGFSFAPGLETEQRSDVLDALYLSLVTVGTLGFGDVVPTTGWLRLATPVQGLIGFALLTAAVSWLGQIHPAVTRRRVLALRLASLRKAAEAGGPPDAAFTAGLLESLAADVNHVTVDLSQHTETYYFHDGKGGRSLAAMIGYAGDLALLGRTSRSADVRLGATMLVIALEEFSSLLRRQFVEAEGTFMDVFAAYAHDHGCSLVRG
ncbi:potassium channel family protein [Streptomyces sp. HMX87]|uniref:potassium channel family protein n=1 Tax=Streptomyces sp. HMX87 TaxID=3390849 RepID=UPI003A83BCFB